MKRKNVTLSAVGLLVSAAAFVMAGCSDMKDDIDDLKKKTEQHDEWLSSLDETVQGLTSDIRAGKLITNVEDLDGEPGGIKITFSDNSTKTITNGKDGSNGDEGPKGDDGKTPLVYIDSEGYWCVAANGVKSDVQGENNPDRMTDDAGNPIKAQGPEGPVGPEGPQGDSFTDVTMRIDENGYLEFTFVNSNTSKTKVVTTPLKGHDNIITAIVENDFFWTFTIDGKVYRFAKVCPAPQSVKVLTPAVAAIKGQKAYAIVSVSPSNVVLSKMTVALDRNGNAVLSRAAAYSYNSANFAEIVSVTNLKDLTDAERTQRSLPVSKELAANGGEWVIEFDVTGDIPWDGASGHGVGTVPAFDVMVEYPVVPEAINAVVSAGEGYETPQPETVYSRSVNSVAFVKSVVEFAEETAIAFDPAQITGFYDESAGFKSNVTISDFAYDLSYVTLKDATIESVTWTNAGGSDKGAVSDTYFTIATSTPEDGAADNVLGTVKVSPIASDDALWNKIATGDVLTLTVKVVATDMTGAERDATMTIKVSKVKSEIVLSRSETLIPIADKVFDNYTWADFIKAVQAAGYTREEAESAVIGTEWVLLKAAWGNNTSLKDAVPATGIDAQSIEAVPYANGENMVITVKNTINEGKYYVKVPFTIKDRTLHAIVPVFVTAADYTVNLKSGITLEMLKNAAGEKVLTYKEYASDGDVIKYAVDLADLLDLTTVKTETPNAPGYEFVSENETLDGNGKGLIASPAEVTYTEETDGVAQRVTLLVKYATGQEIPVQVLENASTTKAGNEGEIYVAIFSDKLTDMVTDPVDGGTISTAIDFDAAKATAQDITSTLTSVTFTDAAGSAYTVSGYKAIKADPRIESVVFAPAGVDDNGTNIQMPAGQTDLIVIDNSTADKVTFTTKGNITAWTGEALQKVKVTVTDKWGNEESSIFTIKLTHTAN